MAIKDTKQATGWSEADRPS